MPVNACAFYVGKNIVSLSITTNSAALDAAASASLVNRSLETSMERLSTGRRINSASDDAAGVAISSRLTAEIRGTNQAIRNALDAQALIDTAEGAHKEVENILQRMREVAVQSANDTNSTQDRNNLIVEFIALEDEIDRLAETTTWAGQSLLNANDGQSAGAGTILNEPAAADTTADFTFQIGSGTSADDRIAVSIREIDTVSLFLYNPNNPLVSGMSANIDSPSASKGAMAVIDAVLEKINQQRSKLGAVSNRLNHTVNNLTNMSANLSAARGGIEDADFALETTELAKNQILQQASTAMLAQANASKQNVLGLLRD